jgi:Ca-activated chloride channel family protein
LSFVGREGVIRGQRAEFSLNQLYGGQEKFALVEVEVAPAGAGEEREIASANLVFEDAFTQREVSAQARSAARFSAVEREVVVAANHAVQTDYARNALAVAKDEAIALVDANRRDQAAQVLRQRADELRKLGETYANNAVGEIAASAAPAASKVERDGLSNADRKSLRAEIQQTQSQQASAPR